MGELYGIRKIYLKKAVIPQKKKKPALTSLLLLLLEEGDIPSPSQGHQDGIRTVLSAVPGAAHVLRAQQPVGKGLLLQGGPFSQGNLRREARSCPAFGMRSVLPGQASPFLIAGAHSPLPREESLSAHTAPCHGRRA